MINPNRYLRLPASFYIRAPLYPFPKPEKLLWNEFLGDTIGMEPDIFQQAIFNSSMKHYFAQAYAGHQFGRFVPQLGDGRALMVGEVNLGGIPYDIHLKGSGPTVFARGGDGFCALGPALREFIISHWMKNLGVPTTQTLAVFTTGQTVMREGGLPGAIVVRVARSHIRIGTFEFFAFQEDRENLKKLFEFALNDLYPELSTLPFPDKVESFFKTVLQRQIETVVQWMKIGFIHGVMNTDNMLISGETIDYGPCAFMNTFNPDQWYSSIDTQGRYRYSHQPKILIWNMSVLAEALLRLWEPDNRVLQAKRFQTLLDEGQSQFETLFLKEFSKKIGINEVDHGHIDPSEIKHLISSLLDLMNKHQLDFTDTFRNLLIHLNPGSSNVENTVLVEWVRQWKVFLHKHSIDETTAQECLIQNNPCIIPRNQWVESAISKAIEGDVSIVKILVEAGNHPYLDTASRAVLELLPKEDPKCYRTFCGT